MSKRSMNATFLGTADGHTSAWRNHSGILLRTPDLSILLDCGAPVAQYLKREDVDPNLPHILWLSHAHSDHIGQFPSLIQSLWLRARRTPLHVYAPAPMIPTLRDYLEKCLLFPELIGFPIHWHGLYPKAKFVRSPFTLHAFATTHLHNLASFFRKGYPQTCFDCYGLVMDWGKERYIYSSDLALPQDMASVLKKPVKALFCELTHFPERVLFEELADKPVGSLWITHYPDGLVGREAEMKKLAKDCKFKGSVHIMKDLQSCKI